MSGTTRVFVNGIGLDVAQGSTALHAVRAWNTGEADAVVAGARTIMDSRGLPVDPSTPAHAGAIFRVVAGRARRNDEGAEDVQ